MDLTSTIIAIVLIVALFAGAVLYLWKTKDKGRPSYMATQKVKPTKEEKAISKEDKAAAKEAKKAEKAAKKSK